MVGQIFIVLEVGSLYYFWLYFWEVSKFLLMSLCDLKVEEICVLIFEYSFRERIWIYGVSRQIGIRQIFKDFLCFNLEWE